MQLEDGKTYISKLRARHYGKAAFFTSRLQSCLSATDLHPANLPPSAIVFIRKVSEPGLRALRLGPRDFRLPRAWEREMKGVIENLVSRAYRPALGAVPANADAVCFFERSELLACLAGDWCDGSLLTHWWWQSLFKFSDVWQAILREWLRLPQYIPAALERLAQKREVERFIGKLTDDEAAAILRSMTTTFALVEIQRISETTGQRKAVLQRGASAEAEKVSLPYGELFSPPDLATWRTHLQEDWRGFSFEQGLLRAVGLMLARAPAVARSQAFARELPRWLQDQTASQAQDLATKLSASREANLETEDGVIESTKILTMQPSAFDEREAGDANSRILDASDALEKSPEVTSIHTEQAKQSASRLAQSDQTRPAVTNRKDLPVNADGFLRVEAAASNGASEPEITPANAQATGGDFCAATFFEAHIKTSLGGIFYLINLGLFLNLYGDFTTPMRPGIRLSIWDFLALVGEKLCRTQFEQDALWALLAKLAQRDAAESPGKDFTPPDCWRVPEDWLKPFINRAVWQMSNHRLRVVHAEGFVIVDVPLAGDLPIHQLAQEMEAYGGIENFNLQAAANLIEAGKRSPLEAWLAWLMPYLRARLRCALAVKSQSELAKVLLQHQARVQITPVRLDVFFDLNQLPIEVRLSGLDRNPGWVPAAGRFIEFHYE